MAITVEYPACRAIFSARWVQRAWPCNAIACRVDVVLPTAERYADTLADASQSEVFTPAFVYLSGESSAAYAVMSNMPGCMIAVVWAGMAIA